MQAIDDRLASWLSSPLGASFRAAETDVVAQVMEDVFGFHMLQVGWWGESKEWLDACRAVHCAVVARAAAPSVTMISKPERLAIASDSVDAVLLPHTLEYSEDPPGVLHEVDRVLAGEGYVIVQGFNPIGMWGMRRAGSGGRFPPGVRQLISERRLRDWLSLLRFEPLKSHYYFYNLPINRVVRPGSRMERLGARFAPKLGGGYLLAARKRVYTMTPSKTVWQRKRNLVGGGLVEPTTRNGS